MEVLEELGFRDMSHMMACGIYVLVHKERIAYVGQSTEPFSRIGDHTRKIVFDKVYFIRCDKANLVSLEKEMIKKLKPKLNSQSTGMKFGSKTKSPIPREKYERFGNKEPKQDISAVTKIMVNGTVITLNKRQAKSIERRI